MNNIFQLFATGLLLASLTSCDYADQRLHIKNKENKDYYFDIQFSDTLQNIVSDHFNSNDSYLLKKNETKIISMPTGAKRQHWEQEFRSSNSDTMYIYLFSPDTLNKYNQDEIVQNQNFIYQVKRTLNELYRDTFLVEIPR